MPGGGKEGYVRASLLCAESTVVVSFINGLGDAVLALPALRRLSNAVYGDPGRLVLWGAHDVLEEVLDCVPAVHCPLRVDRYSDQFFVDPHSDLRSAIKYMEQIGQTIWVSLNAYFPFWDPDNELRGTIAPIREVGFGLQPESRRVDEAGRVLHMRDQYLRVIGESAPSTPPERRLFLEEHTRAGARRELARLGVVSPYVAIHSDTEIHKLWDVTSWSALISALRRDGLDAVAVGQPPSGSLSVPVIRGPWRRHAAVVADATAFVGVDSCFAHVADAMQVPGVVLFGPTDPNEWGCSGLTMKVIIAPEGNLSKLNPSFVYNELRKTTRKFSRRL